MTQGEETVSGMKLHEAAQESCLKLGRMEVSIHAPARGATLTRALEARL